MHSFKSILDLSKIKNFIFDLDGTVIDSSSEVLSCLKKAFDKAGINTDEKRFTSDVIGPPLKDIIRLLKPDLTDENVICELVSYFRSFYDYNVNDISVMYNGIFDVLTFLKERECKLFIATLKPKIPTIRLIKKFKTENFFEDIYTIDKFGTNITKKDMIEDIIKKYDLKKSLTVMIGDAKSDIKSAKEAGIYSIGALWGYGDDKTYLINEADTTFNKPFEIIEALGKND